MAEVAGNRARSLPGIQVNQSSRETEQMSEVQIVAQEHEVLVPLNRSEAERLDKRLRLMAGTARENFEKVGRLLDGAKRGRVHEGRGFKPRTRNVPAPCGA